MHHDDAPFFDTDRRKLFVQTVLVTGGAGYVGSILVRKLLGEGYRVVCIDKLMFGGESLLGIWDHSFFEFYYGDITRIQDIRHILHRYAYNAVIHLAAIVGDPACQAQPELAVNTNWEASAILLEQCILKHIPKFIFASTCSNYGKMSDSEAYVDETSPLAPVSLYAELKVKFERFLLTETRHHDDFCPTALRFSTVYGVSPRMRFDLTVNEFTKDLALGKDLVIFGEQFWRPYCHVTDFSRAILHALCAPKEKVAYNVFNVGGTQENYTKKMLITELSTFFPNACVTYVKKDEDPRDYRVSFEKINRDMGFAISHTIRDGIQEVKDVVELGIIQHPEEQRYYNSPHQ